jgi:hypothetical protein
MSMGLILMGDTSRRKLIILGMLLAPTEKNLEMLALITKK